MVNQEGGDMYSDNLQQIAGTLEQALAAQGRLHGVEREMVQQENLIHALEEIKPARHAEYALAVWFGTRYEPVHDRVNEYCRRKEALPILQFDHPLLALHGWCMPETCRFLVFREQLEALAKQLTGKSDGRSVVRGVYRHCSLSDGISIEAFRVMIDPVNELSNDESTLFYNYLRERYGESLPYTWCSTIAEKAHF